MAVRLAKRLLSRTELDFLILSVAGINIRKKLGLNIIAIIHDGKTNTNIYPEYKIERGYIIVVIGSRKSIEQFEEYLFN